MTPLRVVVVDDVEDVRFLLRVQFEMDERFEVVGEGGDGHEAVELSRKLQPDLLVLDRNMPGMGGLEAIEHIRKVAPDTAVILYTAATDIAAHQAALAAGALDVLDKAAGTDFVERLTARLLDRTVSPDAGVELRVGPVSAAAARTWIANSRTILAAVAEHRDLVDVTDEALELFLSLLDQWQDAAHEGEEFLWVTRAPLDEVTRIVEEWAVVDALPDEQLERLGVHWSPPEGQPFFEALTTGVLRALARHEESRRLVHRLTAQWEPYRQNDTAR